MVLAPAALWWLLLGAGRPRPAPASIAVLFALMAPMTLLGFAMVVARTPWYPAYGTGLEGQQAAGVVLWGFAGVAVAVEGVALFAWWLSGVDAPVTDPRDEPPVAPRGSPSAACGPSGSRAAR
jgi:cytochrome c oxidase assembly factor CtaG